MNILKFFKGAKFDYDQIKEVNVIRSLNFQFFFIPDHLDVIHIIHSGADFHVHVITIVINSEQLLLRSAPLKTR